jgi:uncharacterized membrane protein SpoIIM required for sporulation/ABC-type transport system involved in multi-copper enzyme maturation permease subunit
MKHDLARVWLVASRELRDQLRDWRIIFPMIALTVFFPFLMIFTARISVDFVNKYGAGLIGERMVPFLLMVVGFFPVTVALVVALEAFVGEKERGTIEPLLSSPLADWHLYVGKLIAGTIFPLMAAYLGITVYLIGLWGNKIPLPEASMLAQTLILTTAQGLLMVSGAILISAQSTSVRGANLMASFIIIPIAILIQGESVLMFWGTNKILWLAVVGVSILSFLLIRLGLAHFRRESLIGREIDALNIKYVLGIFRREFLGTSRNPWIWYKETTKTLYRQRTSIMIVVIIGIIAVGFTYQYVIVNLPSLLGSSNQVKLDQVFSELSQKFFFNAPQLSFSYIFLNNIRALMVSLILGLFTLSVGGILVYMINLGLVGGVLGISNALGLSPLMVFSLGVLPHGIFEITALVISSAAILHMGAMLVTPDPNRTLSQVLVESLANWFRIMTGYGVPLLAIAALIETYITPQLLQNFLK